MTHQARAYLEDMTRERLRDRSRWRFLAGTLCRIRADGDLLPVRACYGAGEEDTSSGA